MPERALGGLPMAPKLARCQVARSDRYCAFPDVAMAADGSLVCCYIESDAHSPSWSRVWLRRSTDLGITWSPPQELAASTMADSGFCWNCPRVSRLPDGRLALVCDCFDDSPQWAVWLWWSDDGRTWSPPRRILDTGLCPDRVVALPSGRLVLSADCDDDGQVMWASDDAGETWRPHSTIHPQPACEGGILPLDEQTFVCYLRGASDVSPKAISRDGGDTWAVRTTAPLNAHRPCPGVLRSGKVLVTFRWMRRGTYAWLTDPAGAASADPAAERGRLLELAPGGDDWWDYGYSGWVQLADGRVFCVYYAPPADGRPPSIWGRWFGEAGFA